jgi:DinB family protein
MQAPSTRLFFAVFRAFLIGAERRYEMAMLEPGAAADAYKAKILAYQEGADFLALQAAAPEKLAALVGELSAEVLARRPSPDKWSIQELAAHLADDELVGGYRIRMILSSPGTAIQAFDQDVWARTGRYSRTVAQASVQMFRVLRQANLSLLHALTPAEWNYCGIHAERGAESIRDIAMYYAGHDLNHFKQIEEIRRQHRN